jgi:transcriptional regulator with XRE-family HTH domain
MSQIPLQATKSFGINVKWMRQSRKYSQEVLAKQCGLYRTYLSRIESGHANPTLMVIVALAHSLGIEPHELLIAESLTLPKASKPC